MSDKQDNKQDNNQDMIGLSLRVSPQSIAEADDLVDAMAGSPESRIAGRWGRSAVLRIALEEGLKVLRTRAKKGASR